MQRESENRLRAEVESVRAREGELKRRVGELESRLEGGEDGERPHKQARSEGAADA